MEKKTLTKKEIEFIKNGARWNRHFEMVFALLLIASVVVPFILIKKMNVPGLEKIFENSRYYDFFIALGFLITYINERWLRIIEKLTEREGFYF